MSGSGAIDTTSAVSLLFAPGERPSAGAVRALAHDSADFTVSLDPFEAASAGLQEGTVPAAAAAAEDAGSNRWLELLANGLTFDLSGLAPGVGGDLPARGHAYALDAKQIDLSTEAILLTPGPHLSGGRALMPVIRSLAWLAARLATLPGTRAVVWHAARCWNGAGHFRDVVFRWMEGGAFPAFGLTALSPMADGGIQSEGLSLFNGQELRVEPELVASPAEGAKLALRLIHLLVESGPVSEMERLTLPETGHPPPRTFSKSALRKGL